MSQTLFEMTKDLVMAQIQAKTLPPDAMHIALQQTYTSLKALKVLEESNGSVAGVTPETVIPGKPPSPVITVSSVLAFRKHRCENTPLT